MKTLFLAFMLLFANQVIFAQTQESEEPFEVIEDTDGLDLDFGDSGSFGSLYSTQPMIKLSTGFASPEYMGKSLGDLGHFKMIFGFNVLSFKEVAKNDSTKVILRDYSDYGFLAENYTNSSFLTSETQDDNRLISFWKFGFASSEALGYKLGENADISFGQESGFGWQSLNYNYNVPLDSLNIPNIKDDEVKVDPRLKLKDTYKGGTRFSQYYQAFIKIRPISYISIDLGYQQDMIYPRFLFWHALGSQVTEGVANMVVSTFSDKIIESSPYFGPVVNFVLKNAVSYLFMELRKDNVNWPISSAKPLIINSMNIGVNLHF